MIAMKFWGMFSALCVLIANGVAVYLFRQLGVGWGELAATAAVVIPGIALILGVMLGLGWCVTRLLISMQAAEERRPPQ